MVLSSSISADDLGSAHLKGQGRWRGGLPSAPPAEARRAQEDGRDGRDVRRRRRQGRQGSHFEARHPFGLASAHEIGLLAL